MINKQNEQSPPATRGQRKRILFVAEAATLAHVARPYTLARSLAQGDWEVIFACADSYIRLFPEWHWQSEKLRSIAPDVFMSRLARGGRLYSLSELKAYAIEDLQLLDRVQPDVVVGDFRLSLSASARVAGVPYVALTNAYWSPYASRRQVPMPSLPMTRYLGVPLASALFALARPFAFTWHTVPLNQLRKTYGLLSLGLDLRRIYTDADCTLYADVPELVPTVDLPANHRYIGPIEWSPPIAMPALPERTRMQPLVYVTLGSSGSGTLLPMILAALSTVDCHVAVATAGTLLPEPLPNVTVADYLPGDLVCERASLVICNGGSPTSLQAITKGVPVLGIPFNLDQHLNMAHVVAYGAGLSVRPDKATVSQLHDAARTLLNDTTFRSRATELANACRPYERKTQFLAALEDATTAARS